MSDGPSGSSHTFFCPLSPQIYSFSEPQLWIGAQALLGRPVTTEELEQLVGVDLGGIYSAAATTGKFTAKLQTRKERQAAGEVCADEHALSRHH